LLFSTSNYGWDILDLKHKNPEKFVQAVSKMVQNGAKIEEAVTIM